MFVVSPGVWDDVGDALFSCMLAHPTTKANTVKIVAPCMILLIREGSPLLFVAVPWKKLGSFGTGSIIFAVAIVVVVTVVFRFGPDELINLPL